MRGMIRAEHERDRTETGFLALGLRRGPSVPVAPREVGPEPWASAYHGWRGVPDGTTLTARLWVTLTQNLKKSTRWCAMGPAGWYLVNMGGGLKGDP